VKNPERQLEHNIIALSRRAVFGNDNQNLNGFETDDGLGGLFSKLRKKVRKIQDKVHKAVVPKVIRKLDKKILNTARNITKQVEKVAPVALAAVATAYAGPAAGSAVLALSAATTSKSNPKLKRLYAAGAVAEGAYAAFSSPTMTVDATRKAESLLQSQGIKMATPAAKAVLTQYMAKKRAESAKEMQQTIVEQEAAAIQNDRATNESPSIEAKTDLTKFILPAVGVMAALALS
jgi:hypothetical protein